jgi:serine/threonine protein kinase
MSLLGKGAYGQVHRVDGEAVKQYHRLPSLIQEYVALMYLKDCEFIVKPISVDYRNLTLTMELYDMNMRQWITNESMSDDCVNFMVYSTIRGLIELQDRQLSHSDLKPSNILIKKNPFRVVLGDCGFVSRANYSKQQRTAQNYRDIIVANDDKHDMFSLGIMLMELYLHIKPELRNSYEDYKTTLKRCEGPDHIKDLLKRLVDKHRERRPTAREVMTIIFKQSPKAPSNKHTAHYDEVYRLAVVKYPTTLIDSFVKMCTSCETKLGMHRGKRGLKALFLYMMDKKMDKELYQYFVAATCVILASTFSQHPPQTSNILEICQITKLNKGKLMHCLKELSNHQSFVDAIFS